MLNQFALCIIWEWLKCIKHILKNKIKLFYFLAFTLLHKAQMRKRRYFYLRPSRTLRSCSHKCPSCCCCCCCGCCWDHLSNNSNSIGRNLLKLKSYYESTLLIIGRPNNIFNLLVKILSLLSNLYAFIAV